MRDYKEEVNKLLLKHLKPDDELNFCHLFTPVRKGSISFIGKFIKDNKYITLDSNLNVIDFEINNDIRPFYGVSVKIDSYLIIRELANKRFIDSEGLESFIKEYSNCFTLHKNKGEKYLLPFAKLAVLSIASNFGLKIQINDQSVLNIFSEKYTKNRLVTIKDNIVTINGCPNSDLFTTLNNYKYTRKESKDEDEIPLWILSESAGDLFDDIWENKDNIILTRGDVFYSGATLKILGLKENEEPLYANDNIASVYVEFEESSYGTIFTLDNNFTMHPLLNNKEKEALREMYTIDDNYKQLLEEELNNNNNPKEEINILNKYLQNSFNVNQLVITGNIISEDNILLVARRDNNSIDAKKYYPSVNGNCEVINENVEFYKRSASEDFPTIDINSIRIDFYDELCRETYAELNLNTEDNSWNCYGITLSGNIPTSTVDYNVPQRRRMHLNILCEQKVQKSFESIVESQKLSTEKYENDLIRGIKMFYYKNFFEFLIQGLLYSIASLISKNVPIILSFIALIALYASNQFTLDTLVGTASIIVTLFALFGFFINVHKYYKNYIYVFVIGKKNIVSTIYKRFHKEKSHPVCFASILCYYANKKA